MESIDPCVMLLDADGVLLPFTKKPGWRRAPRKFVYTLNDGRTIRDCYAPQLISEIRQIIRSGACEVVWASSWNDEADKLEQEFGFPVLRRAFPTCAPETYKEKYQAALRVINSGRRLIWIDDSVIPLWGEIYGKLTKDGRSLLIRPNPKKGLQPEDMVEIRKFIGIESLV